MKDDSISTNFDKYLSVLVKLVYVSLITDMDSLFSNDEMYNKNFEISKKINWNDPRNYIGNWNVSNVTDMSAMFEGIPFNQNINNWDISNVQFCVDNKIISTQTVNKQIKNLFISFYPLISIKIPYLRD